MKDYFGSMELETLRQSIQKAGLSDAELLELKEVAFNWKNEWALDNLLRKCGVAQNTPVAQFMRTLLCPVRTVCEDFRDNPGYWKLREKRDELNLKDQSVAHENLLSLAQCLESPQSSMRLIEEVSSLAKSSLDRGRFEGDVNGFKKSIILTVVNVSQRLDDHEYATSVLAECFFRASKEIKDDELIQRVGGALFEHTGKLTGKWLALGYYGGLAVKTKDPLAQSAAQKWQETCEAILGDGSDLQTVGNLEGYLGSICKMGVGSPLLPLCGKLQDKVAAAWRIERS